jgi:hypothetical protein
MEYVMIYLKTETTIKKILIKLIKFAGILSPKNKYKFDNLRLKARRLNIKTITKEKKSKDPRRKIRKLNNKIYGQKYKNQNRQNVYILNHI